MTVQAWQYFNPVRVLAGDGCAQRIAEFVPAGRVLFLTSAGMVRRGTAKHLMDVCPSCNWTLRTIEPNPDLDTLDGLCAQLKPLQVEAIVALGGGSVIDAAKALSLALCAQQTAPLDAWLRHKAPLPANQGGGLPVFCLPTTAGTGAEVTPFATVWDGRSHKKCSLGSELLFPSLALLDPSLTLSLPWQETLYSALDTTSHALETLWNLHATPVSQGLAVQALQDVVAALPHIEHDLQNGSLRAQLQNASVLAGFAISQSRTALAHAISYPLTAHYGVPHGLACSFTLAALIEQVRRVGAFPGSLSSQLIDDTLGMLKKMRLKQHIIVYCSPEQVLIHLDEMFDPARARNFVLPIDRDFVSMVLMQASAKE